ncbi:MAG: aminopeptidase P N-terminal domain-containing protein [Pseudomonadota bacterium]|nr:aminopeptidase P N-terminal domain-containing protein [Pseudomonadota bacterium]
MNRSEFAKRRKTLMRMIGEDGIAILPSAPVRMRSRDVQYRFRQDSNFYYLTGFAEPDAVAIFVPGRDNGEYVLFCRERDRQKEQWDGSRAGPDGVVASYDANDAFPIDDIDDILPGILETRNRVYCTLGAYSDFDQRIMEWVKTLKNRASSEIRTPHEFVALDHVVHDMRLYKSRAEISALRKAAKIAVQAHRRAISSIRPGLFEYEVEAEYLREFRRHNATISYTPIVGSGANACTLHYIDNCGRLRDGDLILIDCGCEYDYYVSDVTRTMPVNGIFSPEQRAIYEIVLEAQLAAIEKTVIGNHWNDPHDAAVRVITKGLKKIGLLDGTLQSLIRDEAYREYFMHRTGHWLGMDVHDVGDYKVGDEWRILESGMVTTIEPGIYISTSRKVPAKWRNIGVRIEDDVAVTTDGPDILSKGLAKTPDEVEALIAG